MIEEIIGGDILNAEVECLVNPVNCVGVMGAGLALKFKQMYPDNFSMYEAVCRKKMFNVGDVLVHKNYRIVDYPPYYIINFPTKQHWRDSSRLEDIENGLKLLVHEVRTLGIRSIAIPALGCGFGGLRWGDVKELIVREFIGVHNDMTVLLYAPQERKRLA